MPHGYPRSSSNWGWDQGWDGLNGLDRNNKQQGTVTWEGRGGRKPAITKLARARTGFQLATVKDCQNSNWQATQNEPALTISHLIPPYEYWRCEFHIPCLWCGLCSLVLQAITAVCACAWMQVWCTRGTWDVLRSSVLTSHIWNTQNNSFWSHSSY